MSFIATAPTPPKTPETVILNDGFFPDFDMAATRDALRLDGTVTAPRLRHALLGAILEAGNDLAAWKEEMQAQGHTTLAEVPAGARIDGRSRREIAYERAVYCLAKADLIERMPDYDTTAAGQKRAEWLAEAPEEHRRNARWSIADVQAKLRTTVELI
ncbi:head completion/stabilization protein [Bordetella avium]|uniref:head completion/stabilization protein n=1 Tax=Bordetella avium TaxID=521 RepID=UPI0039FC9E31